MDLVEIRKKARAKKGRDSRGSSPAARGGRTPSSIQGVPVEHEAVELPPPPETGRGVEATTVDPLKALFSCRPGIDLATEESYLQGLMERDRETAGELCQWLTFFLADEEYALDIGDVREIIKPREITDVPRAPDFVLGIISLRGVIVPVFDLRRRLKLGRGEITPASRIIVCRQEDRSVGLLVDSLAQVVRFPAQGIEPPPSVLSGLDREMVEGVGRYQGRMLILLDLSSVLDAELT